MNRFALLVPCYNASNFILKFIKNLENQYKEFDEIIFYDDGSKDNTTLLLRDLGFKVIRDNINRGPSYARNYLANVTNCNWSHFHDIDDLLHPKYLQKTSKVADQDKYDVILCNVDWFNSETKDIELRWKYSHQEITESPLNYTLSHPIGGINGLYKKKAFLSVNGFNTRINLWEDSDIHVRLAANNAKFFIIEESLSFAVRHDNSLSSNQKKAWLIRLSLLEEYFKIYKERTNHFIIGLEAQKAASSLIIYKEYKAAKRSLPLSEKCGIQVPSNNNKIWKILKLILPLIFRVKLRILQLRIAFYS